MDRQGSKPVTKAGEKLTLSGHLRTSPARRPTMREVAAIAGVSLKTVSRVVNRETTVDAELATRVRSAIELLGYRRDETASTLRRSDRVSSSIGLIFEDVSNPFHSAVYRAVEDIARARGVLAFAGSSDEDPERERELALSFCSRRVDGLIIVPAADDHSYLQAERQSGVPIVFVDRPPSFLDADAVLSENAVGSEVGVEHLVAGGHQRIAFLGDTQRIYTARERLRGYRNALARAGLQEDPALVRLELHDSESRDRAVDELLDLAEPPTAMFTSQNLITLAVVRKLRRRGLHRTIAIVGFDDFVLADSLDPAVTVVSQSPLEIGRRAGELLFERIDGRRDASLTTMLPTVLIQRGSGELPVPRASVTA
ncbi:MAG: LacI family transcriptional regulator [Gaiellales bacterium]|nr:LacI family transcriptional regulator [Gaiellales bacterium]